MTATFVVLDEAHTCHFAGLHIACCTVDRFYCGAPYHPEAEATEAHSEDEACERCVDMRYKLLCPRQYPTHQHCPFGQQRRCPER